jgi:hypothetical protein
MSNAHADELPLSSMSRFTLTVAGISAASSFGAILAMLLV